VYSHAPTISFFERKVTKRLTKVGCEFIFRMLVLLRANLAITFSE